jgi:hypothetical protein
MRMADYTPASHPLMVHLPADLVEEVDSPAVALVVDLQEAVELLVGGN